MATKTISVRTEAYERLAWAKRGASESFSDVIMRAHWDREPVTAAALLGLVRKRGALYRAVELGQVEEAKQGDQPPRDKWTEA